MLQSIDLNTPEIVLLIKSFCGCFTVQGAVFSKRAPWPPEARKRRKEEKIND
jgi:hypothetical protein